MVALLYGLKSRRSAFYMYVYMYVCVWVGVCVCVYIYILHMEEIANIDLDLKFGS
jgi:hypothetical protein